MLEAALLAASTAVWIVLEAAAAPAEPHARAPRELATGLALLAVHGSALIEHLAFGTDGSLAGGALIAGGVALRVAAIRQLGADFVSVRARPARVAATGVYRWMRHPSEVGLAAVALGAAVLLGSVVAAALAAGVLLPLAVARCRAEDRLLAGAGYDSARSGCSTRKTSPAVTSAAFGAADSTTAASITRSPPSFR
jgi:protein-S-isoprenylcysteine O-methyltransferase Ste14